MDKQETAFKAWLNTILLPATSDQDGDGGQAALASRRLTAKMRGLLWRIYQRDEQFRDVMLRVEQRVEGGHLRIRDEVGGQRLGWGNQYPARVRRRNCPVLLKGFRESPSLPGNAQTWHIVWRGALVSRWNES